MWACAKGHQETAVILYKWNHNALNVKNHGKRTPIDVAHDNGFDDLASVLERMETKRKEIDPPQLLFSSASFINLNSTTRHASATNSTTDNCSIFNAFNTSIYDDINATPLMSCATNGGDALDGNDSIDTATAHNAGISTDYIDNASPKSVESQNSNRSHDGVFLRPGVVNVR